MRSANPHPGRWNTRGRLTRAATRSDHLAHGRALARPVFFFWGFGLSRANESDGATITHGPVAGQAALHDLLQKRDTGLPLISVTQVQPGQPGCPPSSPGNS